MLIGEKYKSSILSSEMKRILFWRMKNEPAEYVCSDEDFDYYNLLLNGYSVMFVQNKYRPDGLRLFVLGEELAKALGFYNYKCMRECLPTMQFSRKMLSVQAIERHFR